MQAAHRVAKNTGILYARMAITIFISLYSTRLVLTALGVNDFGIFNLVGGAISMLMFLNNAMSGATQRFMSFAEGEGNIEKQKNIFNVSFVLHIITAFLAVLLLEAVGYFLFDGILKIPIDRQEAAKLIFHFLVISTFFTIVSVPYDAVINAHENMLLVAILGIVEAFFKLGIAFYILYFSSDKLIVYGLLMAILSILLLIIRQIYCHKKYNEVLIDIKKYFNKSLFREMTSFAGWSLFGCSSSMIGSYGQGIVLNMFFGTVVNAAQGIANQISGQLGAFAGTMLKALNPIIDKSEGAGNRKMMLKASMMGSKVSFFLLMVFYVPVLIEMPYIFKIWLKIVPEYTIIFCRLLLFKNLIEQLFVTMGSSISAVGNIRKYQIYSSFFYVVPLICSYFLFSIGYSPSILYVIYIFFTIGNAILTLNFAKINCDLSIPIYLKTVVFRCVISFILCIGIAFIPMFFLSESISRLIAVIIIGSGSFLPIVWYIGITLDERIQIREVVNKSRN